MEIQKEFLKRNDVVYGCAYDIDNNHEYHRLKCAPVKGIVLDPREFGLTRPRYSGLVFCKLNKENEPIKSSAVLLYARKYSNTYEGCVEIYNNLITERVNYLKEVIVKSMEDIINE